MFVASAAGGECSQSRGRQSPVATRCSMGSSVAAPVGNNGSPRPSPGGQQSPPQQSQISMTSAIPSTSPRPQHSFTDESSHAPMTSSNTSPSVYYVSDCPSFFPQGTFHRFLHTSVTLFNPNWPARSCKFSKNVIEIFNR